MSEKPSPIEFMKQTAETERAKENSKRQQEITIKLVENSGVFGGQIEEERSLAVCQEIFNVFGSKYESVKGMESVAQNPNATDRQKSMAKENLGVLGKAAFVSINYTFKEYPDGLITSQLRAEEIDGFLPEELKGLGKYVVEADKNATEEDKKKIVEMDILTPQREQTRKNNSVSDKDKRLAEIERANAMRQIDGEDDKNGEGGRRNFYMLEKKDLINLEMSQRSKEQFHFNPPYPDWFEASSAKEKRLWMIRMKMINGVAYKQALRNVDAEKLMMNRSLDLNRDELKLLCEMPGFQESMQMMFSDLFDFDNESGGGKFLRLKRKPKQEGVFGQPLDTKVENILTHFEAYKEKLALKMQYPDESEDKINARYLEEERAGDRYRGAVGAAWNFLYIGNIIESADVDRQLKPTEVVSDKLRSMIHPLQKALGKWGVYKEGKESKDYTKVTGEEEPMGGPIASWIQYHLEMDEISKVSYENSFRKKLIESKVNPLPKRMATSFVEMFKVSVDNGRGGTEQMVMSEAILQKKKIVFSEEDVGSDLDIFTDFRDAMDGCKTAFDYLTGKQKLEFKKNGLEWARNFQKDIALVRQTKTKSPLENKYLSFVDDPEFLAWVIASSAGFEHRSEEIMLDYNAIGSNGDNYYYVVENIINLPGLVGPNIDKNKTMRYLSAVDGPWKTQRVLAKIKNNIRKQEILLSKSRRV